MKKRLLVYVLTLSLFGSGITLILEYGSRLEKSQSVVWSESFSIGALMNTRGLVELVVLNIGYDPGILPDRIFSIMVLMALVTTGMTSPLLFLIAKLESRKKAYPPWG